MENRIKRRKSLFPWTLGCIGCVGFILLLWMGILIAIIASRGWMVGWGECIALIRIEGVITDSLDERSFFSAVAGARSIIRLLHRAEEDDSIRAVVLRINSPGGSAAASQEIYQAILRFKRSGKPIVVSMGEVAASGGYYIASAGDTIFATPATLTGSIGAIWYLINMEKLLAKLGIQAEAITSGPYKDIGSEFRKLKPQERRLIQKMVDDVYQQFLRDVARGRKLTIAQIKPIADGRILTGRQALKFQLVDKLGGLEDAIAYAGRKVGIKGRPRVKELRWHRGWGSLLGLRISSPVHFISPRRWMNMLYLDTRLCAPWWLGGELPSLLDVAINTGRKR